MDIGLLNEKVTFQKNTVITDSIGNHKNVWEDFYTCHAAIGGEGMASSKEKERFGVKEEFSSVAQGIIDGLQEDGRGTARSAAGRTSNRRAWWRR